MPNGRRPHHQVASLTAVGVGERGVRALERFAEESSDDDQVTARFICVDTAETADSRTDHFQFCRLDAPDSGGSEADSTPPYADSVKATATDGPGPAPLVRRRLDSRANFLPLFERIESTMTDGATPDAEWTRSPGHLNLLVGDLSDPAVRGVVPLVAKMLDDGADALSMPTLTGGMLLAPVGAVADGESIAP
ncbi:hypothetical protein [Halosimplex halophilum]|uniref:hypothetical protein n=1 Tax=Halosimplex halophilum TaxID=2559572 RepID=UPI00107F34B3|nr:hypothetical protein [Halosimplex halophilum]